MKKFKLTKKRIIIAIMIVVVLGSVGYRFFAGNGEQEFDVEKVVRGAVVKEVSETGTVKVSEKANLSFKYSGRIQQILVRVGDTVAAGQVLARQNRAEISIQLAEAQASLEVTKAKKADARVSLRNKKQSLKDVEADAEEDLNNAYEDALTALDDANLKVYNAYQVAKTIQRDYFTSGDQESNNVITEKNVLKDASDNIVYYVNLVKNGSRNDTDTALSQVKDELSEAKESLEVIRNMTGSISYRNDVSDADKTSLDNQKSYINTAYSDVVNAKQTISTTKVVNTSNINSAKSEIATLEAQLADSGLYDAQISQSEASISLLENKIYEGTLRSPAKGQITDIDGRLGETVQATETVISFLPTAPFKIEVDIYEEDIVNVEVGDVVKINLVAFSDETLMGSVVSVDPAEKLIDGVVYYEVNIDFKEVKKGTKIGMTADIIIETERKDNVLIISEEALNKDNGKNIVEVIKGEKIEEREIKIGMEGEDYIEVLSGLEEGEEVVIR